MNITVYPARRLYTMNPSQPTGECLAVRDGRVLSVAPLDEIKRLGDVVIDERYADKVMMPGFVEGHSHALEGIIWDYVYLGWFDKIAPDGTLWAGVRDAGSIQQRLRRSLAALPVDQRLIAWGFDPIYFDGARLDKRLLDAVSPEVPIIVMHASLHVMTVNSAVIDAIQVSEKQIDGIVRDSTDQPTGELQELPAMHLVFDHYGIDFFEAASTPRALVQYARAARREGITTITDLLNPLSEKAIASMRATTADPDFPVRLVPALNALDWEPGAGSERVRQAMRHNHDKLHFGIVKIVTDGAIQNFTARLMWPGYLEMASNGVWNAPPQVFHDMVQHYHQAGLQLHIHTNGDEAVEIILEALEEALTLWPRPDHRHTLQHVQLIRQDQLRRVRALGACLNIFANHIYYWGDIHRTRTLGFDRCQRLEPTASAERLGIPFGIHCDAPVTPLSPLFTAHCAHTRETASGEVLGSAEAISRACALEAITLGAARTLHLDHCIGSLEPGKWADVTVLDDDPLQGDKSLKEIGVHATLLGGRPTTHA
ncbi:amidohydrolase [Billgrantia endophytica]|uniref:Amidohydrolase n=1 Tax=Billgrantia endophytica TaxID=2033802 RepID=A0A2N7U5N8_9GAMM|nr:amidohydrolase [Halomonas endophytica]PMR75732.1 amidohydrolase [Halomonas endophytica]